MDELSRQLRLWILYSINVTQSKLNICLFLSIYLLLVTSLSSLEVIFLYAKLTVTSYSLVIERVEAGVN
jgi:hypothetical protein